MAEPSVNYDVRYGDFSGKETHDLFNKFEQITGEYFEKFHFFSYFPDGQDVMKTNSPYDLSQMSEIWQGLEKGLDVSIYAKPEFNAEQMAEIRLGLETSIIDVQLYADPALDAGVMEAMRCTLQETALMYDNAQREVLSDAVLYVADVRILNIIHDPDYTAAQMKDLMLCGCNSHPYLDETAPGLALTPERQQHYKDSAYHNVKALADQFKQDNAKKISKLQNVKPPQAQAMQR